MNDSHDGDGTSTVGEDCFFADATLDLEEAQGIAYQMTPDLTQRLAVDGENIGRITIPNLEISTNSVLSHAQHGNGADGNTAIIRRLDTTAGATSLSASDQNVNLTSDSIAPLEMSKSKSNSNTAPTSTPTPSDTPTTRSIELQAIHNDSINVNSDHHTNQPTYRPRPPRRPRDAKWTTAFLFVLPLLLAPYIIAHVILKIPPPKNHEIEKSDVPAAITLGLGILLARVFYISRGGGEGEDRRYLTSQVLIISNMASCVVLPLLTLTFYYLHVYSPLYHLIVFGLVLMTMREIYSFASLFKMGVIMTEGVNDGQRAFFRMLVNASLDILSRSLRCQSFYRTVVLLLGAQLGVLLGLRRALEYSYRMNTFGLPWIVLIVLIGYWCVNIVIRLLSYLACGGVTSWFAEQSRLMEEMEQIRKRENGGLNDNVDAFQNVSAMPEAYRNVDASAYSQGFDFDEGMDDDYLSDVEDTSNGRTVPISLYSRVSKVDGNWMGQNGQNTSTIKAFLFSALGNSRGSIIHCALLGGFANSVWSFLHGVEWLISVLSRFSLGQRIRYRVMNTSDSNSGPGMIDKLRAFWQSFHDTSSLFVRNHHDLGLCHVAAYYKSYTRAANDVMTLIDSSGIEPILHEDISSHMCSSISKSIAGIIVIFVGQYLTRTPDNNHTVVCEIMVTTFAMSYVLIYTMMEPLQASTKAVYVCFAQNHQSLSHAFPILYHRLARMSRERNDF